MNAKTKNALIGGLLAIVFVMAVGYAAFAQQLTINGTASVTSNWDVHFDQSKTNDLVASAGVSGATDPTGNISFGGAHSATLTANLVQPGDTVTFTLTVKNGGNIAAALAEPTVTMDGDESDEALIAKKGNIQFTVTSPTPNQINENETATMTVKAEFISSATTATGSESASVTINLNATQAGA